MHADVSARSITILGHLQGNVKAGERTEIRKTGSFEGELLTAQIVIKDGAVFRGSVALDKPGQNAANTPAADGPATHCTEAEGSGYSANRGDHAEPRRFNGPQALNTRRFERQGARIVLEFARAALGESDAYRWRNVETDAAAALLLACWRAGPPSRSGPTAGSGDIA